MFFGRTRDEHARVDASRAARLHDVYGALVVHVHIVRRVEPRGTHKTFRREMENLVGLYRLDEVVHADGVRDVAINNRKPWIVEEVFDIPQARQIPPLRAEKLHVFPTDQKIRHVRTDETRNARDEYFLFHPV